MAVTGSYKQECPSCEAMVLIKDRALVGKKIDCPQCKYRFVVEAPAGTAEEPAPTPAKVKAKPKPEEAVTAQKPAPAPPGAPVKKTVKRKPIERDDDDVIDLEKDKGSNKTVMIGIGLSVFAVLLLGVGAYFAFFTGGDGVKPRGTNIVRATTPKPLTSETKTVAGGPVEITNLLPADTRAVVNVNVKELMSSFLRRVLFDTPGGFHQATLERQLGLKVDEIERLVLSIGKKDEPFAVLRAVKPLDMKAIEEALKLQPGPDSPIKDQAYFVTPPSSMGEDWKRMLGANAADKPQALALRLADSQTLVVTSLGTMKEFLEAGGKPPTRPVGKPAAGAPAPSNRYLTVEPSLKALLDAIEPNAASLITVGMDVALLAEPLKKQWSAVKATAPPEADEFVAKLLTAQAMGISLQIKGKTVVNVGADGKDASGLLEKVRAFGRKQLTNPALDKAGFFLTFDGINIGERGPDIPKVTLESRAYGSTAVWSADLPTGGKADLIGEVEKRLQPTVVGLRAAMDMAGSPSRVHELAAALKQLVDKERQFPRGTFEGPRLPGDRVGWLAALLPYLGQERIAEAIVTKRTWKEGKNAALGAVLIPPFLDGRKPPATWTAIVPSLPGAFGATHFVGIAGVGRDAADYAADDPAVAKKLGIFGYDRATRIEDVKDGPANTIAIIQVPPRYPRPWIAGGGASVEGVPEKGSVAPFVCVTYEGKRGTYAIMANGDVRFIPETIADDAFKALCTINGGDKVDLDKETTLVPPPGKPVAKEKP